MSCCLVPIEPLPLILGYFPKGLGRTLASSPSVSNSNYPRLVSSAIPGVVLRVGYGDEMIRSRSNPNDEAQNRDGIRHCNSGLLIYADERT